MTTPTIPPDSDFDQPTLPTKPSIFAGASPKLTFIMGIVSGIAVVSLVGFVLTASYGLLGNVRGANQPAGTGASVVTPTVPAPNQPPAPPSKVTITLKSDDHIRGNANAPVTLVEYSDLECPFCKRFHPAMQQLMQEYAGKVKWVYRHFPLSFHANAQKEGEATECAGKLGGNDKFWAYTDKIFERTTSNGTGFALDALVPLAKELGLNEAKFKTCLDGGEFTAHVRQDLQEGTSFGVNGTPTTFVNGQPVEGAVPYDQLKAVVQSLLK
ncbi:MAG: DsbA family protein [Candidatus Kerfeldbacteria bacterium]|nr:DsbA family protein [Candidatus Kerfeldbacteria bacterium]